MKVCPCFFISIILFIIIIVLLNKKENRNKLSLEKFDQNNIDFEAINNLSVLAKNILDENDNLILPSNVTIPGNLTIGGELKSSRSDKTITLSNNLKTNGWISAVGDVVSGHDIRSARYVEGLEIKAKKHLKAEENAYLGNNLKVRDKWRF